MLQHLKVTFKLKFDTRRHYDTKQWLSDWPPSDKWLIVIREQCNQDVLLKTRSSINSSINKLRLYQNSQSSFVDPRRVLHQQREHSEADDTHQAVIGRGWFLSEASLIIKNNKLLMSLLFWFHYNEIIDVLNSRFQLWRTNWRSWLERRKRTPKWFRAPCRGS